MRPPPPGVWKLSVVELSGKNQRIALDEYSRLVVRFLILGQKLTPFWGVKGQIFAKSAFFQLYIIIFQKLLIVATYGFHQRVPRSILNNIACRYSFWMEYMRRTVSRKGTASPSSAKSPEGKLGQWPRLTSDSVERHYKHVHAKN